MKQRVKVLLCCALMAVSSIPLSGCNDPPGKNSDASETTKNVASNVTQYKFTIDPEDVGAKGTCSLTYCCGTWTMDFKGTYAGYTMSYRAQPYTGLSSGEVLKKGTKFNFQHATTTACGQRAVYHQGALEIKSIKKTSNNNYDGVLFLNPDPCTCGKCR